MQWAFVAILFAKNTRRKSPKSCMHALSRRWLWLVLLRLLRLLWHVCAR
jgi:hypothetical protein